MIEELQKKLYWLSTHNKNYTKQQYYTIMDCLELIEELIKKEKELEKFIGEYEHEHIQNTYEY